MTIVFRGKKILDNPVRSIKSMILSTLRSVLFLSCYVTTAWSLPCLLRVIWGKDERWMYYSKRYISYHTVNGILAGCMVLIEQPGRRLELGMYVLPRALESLFLAKWEGIRYGETIYFSLATGILMSLYQNDPGSIHPGKASSFSRARISKAAL